jgi:hypothetical protein
MSFRVEKSRVVPLSKHHIWKGGNPTGGTIPHYNASLNPETLLSLPWSRIRHHVAKLNNLSKRLFDLIWFEIQNPDLFAPGG